MKLSQENRKKISVKNPNTNEYWTRLWVRWGVKVCSGCGCDFIVYLEGNEMCHLCENEG